MQNVTTRICTLLILAIFASANAQTATYIGSEACQSCHAGAFGNQYTTWNQSLHSKIHLPAIAANIKGDFTKTVSMGASYGNAQVILRVDGDKFFGRVGASGQEYEIKFTYGGGWKQRYLVKISNSYYMLPIQWNSKGYLDNSTGDWVAYNPQNWFDAAGNPKPTSNNTFRSKSWDKNCSGCHITGNNVQRVVAGNDTSYVSTWANNSSVANIVVGCEACHGPASLHPANAFGTDKKIINPGKFTSNERKLEACGQCHFRGFSNHDTFEFPWDENTNTSYIPGDELAKFIINKPGVWPDGVTARQHHQQYQEFLTSKHSTNPFVPVNCFTCHDPHQPPGKHQIVDNLQVDADNFKVSDADNTLCLACHATHGPFANITKDMVKDPVANRSAIAAVVSQHTRHSYDPENANNTKGASRCSSCHLVKTAVTAKSYDIRTHTFDVIPPEKTIFYKDVTTPTVGMLNACATACHRNASGAVSALGVGTDANLTRWNEATDLALADTLMHYYGPDGIWWKRTLTGVADREVASVPEVYTLQQNYPNPFNPVTVIPFTLPKSGKVELKVFNMLGKEVVTVLEQNVPPGKHAVMFNGSTLASGVYFYRLTVNDFVGTKKMVLMK